MQPAKRAIVVGAGTMGGGYARLFSSGRAPGVELVGVVDVDGERADNVAGANGVPGFTDVEQAVRECRPDFAYVATPDPAHRRPVETLAGMGIAVLVEKPLATTVDDGLAMLNAVEQAGVYAEVNYSNRWSPPFIEAKRSVEAGEVGAIRSMNVRLNNAISSPVTNLAWSATTTPAWFLMSHCLDLAHWLSGLRAESVYATAGYGLLREMGVDAPDWIHATVRYERGADGVFESLWILPEAWPGSVEFRFRAVGTRGVIDADTTYQNIAVTTDQHRYPGTINWAQQRIAGFIRAMDGQGRTRVGFEDGLEVTRILVALHRSIASGQPESVA